MDLRAIIREELKAAGDAQHDQAVRLYQHHRRAVQQMHLENTRRFDALEGRCANVEQRVASVDAAIRDPEKGAVTRLVKIEKDIEHHNKNTDNTRQWARGAILASIGALVTAILKRG